MTVRIAINGFGRIGRCVVRALAESERNDVEIAAINDLADCALSAHLLKYDSTHGILRAEVYADSDSITVGGKKIRYTSIREVENLPWKELQIDAAMECTGLFTARDSAAAHLSAGAKKVLISAPAKDADATIVYGVNHQTLSAKHKVVSNASCTTNCLAPVAKVMHDSVGIKCGWMNTVHSYTNDQRVLDSVHSDWRRARAAAESIIPAKTGAAQAIGLVIPELEGKLSGVSVRVPTKNVSLVDLTFLTSRDTNADEINSLMKEAADGKMKGVVAYNELPLVSADFNNHPASCIFDATQTKVADGRLAKIFAWYDNEWGFSNRMLDVAREMSAAN